MSAEKKSPPNTAREAKKAMILNTGKKSRSPVVIAVIVVIAVTAGLGLFLFPGGDSATSPTAITQTTTDDGQIAYAVSQFDDDQAHHFSFADAASGTAIAYFILKSTDGVIRAAFDACDVCWPEGKGYVQDGTAMVCRNCNRRFESVMVNEVQGGCNPAPLTRTIAGDRVVIRIDDLRKGQGYFNLSKKA